MPYANDVRGTVAVNYRAAPIEPRLDKISDPAAVYRTDKAGDPPTPVIEAYAGDRLKVHVVAPWSEQAQVFTIEGHDWPIEPGHAGTNIVGSTAVGGLEALTIEPRGGAGGLSQTPGDYIYGDSRLAYREAGLWGILRVHAKNDHVQGLAPLPAGSRSSRSWWPWIAFAATAVLIGAGLLMRRRFRRS